jgi:hypothetical protein
MIVTEFYREREDGIKLFRTYSDAHKYVSREGESVKYEEIICSEDRLGVFVESEEEIVKIDENGDDNENGAPPPRFARPLRQGDRL